MDRTRIFAVATGVALATVLGVSLGVDGVQPGIAASQANPDFATVASRINKQFPDLEIDSVRPSPMPGLLEVVSGHRVLYSDMTGSFLINGHLIDVQNKVDLTDRADQDLSKIDPKILPLADSFAEVRGTGKRQLYVFSDPDCPYCKRLESEFPKLNDVTIHVFLYPLVSIHPNAHTNAVAVWCAKDRVKAWDNTMQNSSPPKAATCDNPVDRNVALGEKLGFTGTPTLVFADGRVMAGARPAAEIERLMGRAD